MNFIFSREAFKKYIKQKLGEPVIRVDVADEQMENCVNDALDMFQQWHNEGSCQMFLKQMVTPSELEIVEDLSSVPARGTRIEGLTSKATAIVFEYRDGKGSSGKKILCRGIKENKPFEVGEKIKVGDKEYTLAKVTLGIIDEHRIKMPDYILGVTRIIPVHSTSSSQNLFDVQYQVRLNDIYDLTSTDLVYYEMAMEHLNLLSFELNANPSFEFNRHEGYVYPLCKWEYDVNPGDYLLLQVYRELDPTTSNSTWNNYWLKRYAIALVKLQWSMNLSKFQGIQLPGGVTLDGVTLKQEATQEIAELENELMNLLPPSAFLVG